MPVVDDIDALRELEREPAPAAVARHPRLDALRAQALAMVREQGLAQPRACWRIVALDEPPDRRGTLMLEDKRLRAPRLVPREGRLTSAAIGAATLGDGIERAVSRLFAERRASLALALDGVANAMLFALSRRVQDRIAADARRQGLSVAGELRAGDPGLALRAQRDVLDLCGGAEIGITLADRQMMHPTKSTTFVHGVGIDLPPQTWSRCERCRSRARCAHAQAHGLVAHLPS